MAGRSIASLIVTMNHSGYQQKNIMRNCKEMRMKSVVCPKPPRFGHMNNNHIRPFKPQFISYYQSEIEDSKARKDLLDIILPKESMKGSFIHTMYEILISTAAMVVYCSTVHCCL